MLGWYECMNIFDACNCQASWIGDHMLDVAKIWFSKPPSKPPDPSIDETIQDEINLPVPSSELVEEQVKDINSPFSPLFMSNEDPTTYEINVQLSNRWNARKRTEHPSFFQQFSTKSQHNLMSCLSFPIVLTLSWTLGLHNIFATTKIYL